MYIASVGQLTHQFDVGKLCVRLSDVVRKLDRKFGKTDLWADGCVGYWLLVRRSEVFRVLQLRCLRTDFLFV